MSTDTETYDSQDDQTEDVQAITFDDLLSFAFQVAKGMEFLSSKNVRNISLMPQSLFNSLTMSNNSTLIELKWLIKKSNQRQIIDLLRLQFHPLFQILLFFSVFFLTYS